MPVIQKKTIIDIYIYIHYMVYIYIYTIWYIYIYIMYTIYYIHIYIYTDINEIYQITLKVWPDTRCLSLKGDFFGGICWKCH